MPQTGLTCVATVTGHFGNCRKLSALSQVTAFSVPVIVRYTVSDSYRDSYRATCQVNAQLPTVTDSYWHPSQTVTGPYKRKR